MNQPTPRTAFWRMLWKEYRAQRALWCAMVAITLFFQLSVWVLQSEPTRANLRFNLAVILPAVYALGCGALLFAAEHDQETFEFQRCLPLTTGPLLAGKLLFALGSLAVMWPVTLLVGWGFSEGKLPSWQTGQALWGVWGVAALELLAWSVFFSLLSRRVLVAAILGVVAASLSVQVCVGILYRADLQQVVRFTELSSYVHALPPRLGILLLVIAADFVLGRRWLARSLDRSADEAAAEDAYPRLGKIVRWTVWRRGSGLWHLLWQHTQQSWRLMAAVSAGLVLLAVWISAGIWGDAHGQIQGRDWIGLAVQAAMILATLLGVCAFVPDQRRGAFRFLADRGVQPSIVWLSRQLVWGLPVLLMVVVAELVVLRQFGHELARAQAYFEISSWQMAGLGLAAITTVYGAGQLCSLFFRSSILAAVFGVVFAGLLVAWAGLMGTLEVPWSFAVLPLPAILLGVSWLRTGDWLRERNTWQAWLKSGGALVLGLGLVAAAVCRYRALDIPEVNPGFVVGADLKSLSTADHETLALYQKACAQVVPQRVGQSDDAWVAANQSALELALQASQRPFTEHPQILAEGVLDINGERHLVYLLQQSGRQLEAQGQPQQAVERYLAVWRMIRQLQSFSLLFPSVTDWQERNVYAQLLAVIGSQKLSAQELAQLCRQVEEVFHGAPLARHQLRANYEEFQRKLIDKGLWSPWVLSLVRGCLPWEYHRAQRVLNVLMAETVRSQETVYQAVLEGKPAGPIYLPGDRVEYERSERLLRTTPLFWHSGWFGNDSFWYLRNQTEHQAMLTCLALAAWKAEHGTLPPTLEALVGPYLERMPLEPLSGKPFHYYPQGLPQAVEVTREWNPQLKGEGNQELQVPAGTPLLWIGHFPAMPADDDAPGLAWPVGSLWSHPENLGILIP